MDEPTSVVLLAYGDTRSILRSSYRTYLYIPVLVIRLSVQTSATIHLPSVSIPLQSKPVERPSPQPLQSGSPLLSKAP